jgi:hypothetical protein
MARKHGEQKPQATAQPSVAHAAGVVVGRLLPGSSPIAPLVDFDGNLAGPLPARTTIALDAVAVNEAVSTACGAVLVFENGDPKLPILTGLLQREKRTSLLQELLVSPRAPSPASKPPREAKLDGERVVLEGKQEVVLKCGDASITLRRDGKVIVRGAYVETHARGVNRIKGGSVKIN